MVLAAWNLDVASRMAEDLPVCKTSTTGKDLESFVIGR